MTASLIVAVSILVAVAMVVVATFFIAVTFVRAAILLHPLPDRLLNHLADHFACRSIRWSVRIR